MSAAPTPTTDANTSLSPRWILALKILAWAYVASVIAKHFLIRPHTMPGVDFPKHWLAPVAILEGRNLYLGDELWLYYNYPQWSALVTFWLGWFSREAAEHLWKAMNALFVVLSWFIAWRSFRLPDVETPSPAHPVRDTVQRALSKNWLLFTAVIFAAFDPAAKTVLFTGNIDPWNLLAMTAFIAALLHGRDRLAGVAWAVLCLVKMVPVLLIVPIVLWRRWRVMQGWFVFMLGYLLLLIATQRLKYEWFFVTDVMEEISFEWRWISISVPQFFLKYFLPESWNEDPQRFALFTNGVLGFFGLLMLGGIARLRQLGASFLRVLEFGIIFLPLLTPLLEGHHYAWTLPAFFLQLGRWFRGEMKEVPAAVYAVGWFVISRDFFYIDMMHNFGYWPKFMPMFGGLLLIVAAGIEMFRPPAEETARS